MSQEKIEKTEPVILSKLTLKGMGLDTKVIRKAVDASEKPVLLAHLLGHAKKVEEVPNTQADGKVTISKRFSGQFIGINEMTGQEFVAGKLYMPDVAADILAGMITRDTEMLEFGFSITAKPSTRPGGTGYEFSAASFVKAATNPLDALKAKIPPKRLTK
jgi:hypothetical protein